MYMSCIDLGPQMLAGVNIKTKIHRSDNKAVINFHDFIEVKRDKETMQKENTKKKYSPLALLSYQSYSKDIGCILACACSQ